MGDARRNLAHGGQVLGTQHFMLALMQLLDHIADLVDDALHLAMNVAQVALLFQGNRSQFPIQPTGGVADAHAQLIDRLAQAARHPVSQEQPRQRATQADGQQAPPQGADDPVIFPIGLFDLAQIVAVQLDAGSQDFAFEVVGQGGIVSADTIDRDGCPLVPALEVFL